MGPTPPAPLPSDPLLPLSPNHEHHRCNTPLSLYLYLLQFHPLTTKIVTSGILTAISDVLAQIYESATVSTFDYIRIMAMFLAGAFLTAPMYHCLYQFLEHTVPSTKLINTAIQLLVDQLVAAPIWLALFLPTLSILEGEQDVFRGFKTQFINGLLTIWIIFPLVQVVNFSIVPVQYRVLVLNLCDLVFTGILSWIKHGN